LPVVTTKQVFLRGIIEELLWFIKGSTDSNILKQKNVNFWNHNGSKNNLEKLNLPYEEGDLGPVYGFQWRHFGADYIDCKTDYTDQGVDQLKYIVDEIRKNPKSRRLILSSWNPKDLNKMVLPPCHCLAQFYVDENKNLSCILYQRSGDVGLGVPFNITSYALLTHMIAHVCKLNAHEFIHVLGDAHIYMNHVDKLKEQITRHPYPSPKIFFNQEKNINNLEDFEFLDFKIENYQHYGKIELPFSL
jgi:thymidylate synthase